MILEADTLVAAACLVAAHQAKLTNLALRTEAGFAAVKTCDSTQAYESLTMIVHLAVYSAVFLSLLIAFKAFDP